MQNSLFNLKGRVALVTGGSKGLGKAMARGFAEARRRTWASNAPWRLADNLALLAGLVIIGAGFAARALLPA